jgi:hypothetical protein
MKLKRGAWSREVAKESPLARAWQQRGDGEGNRWKRRIAVI